MAKRFLTPIQSTVSTGTAPLVVASTTAVTNLNSDLLDGQQGSYYQNAGNLNAGTILAARMPSLTGDITTTAGAVATTLANTAVTSGSYGSATSVATFTVDSKGRLTAAGSTNIAIPQSAVTNLTTDLSAKANLASPTFTGTVTVPTLSLTTADTATESSHYIIETASDGILRPKTLANVRTEIVTRAAVNSAAATTVGTITSGTWQGSAISATYIDSAIARLASPALTGTPTAPTAAANTNTTQVATTAFVTTANNLKANIASPTFTGTLTASTGAFTGNVNINNNTQTRPSSGSGLTINWNWTGGGADVDFWNVFTTANQSFVFKQLTGASTHTDLLTILANGNATFAGTVTATSFSGSAALTGTPTAPTATAGTNTTQIATTAYVTTAVASAGGGSSIDPFFLGGM